jgi:hypothetical protein
LIEEDPPSKPIRFLLGLRGSMTQRDGGAMREVAKRGHDKRGTGAAREVTIQQPTVRLASTSSRRSLELLGLVARI